MQLAISPSALEWRRTVRLRDSKAATRRRPRKPVAPVTRMSLFIGQKLLTAILELVDCAHVVVHAPDIQPIASMPFDVDGLFAGKHVEHEIIEAVFLSRRHVVK